MKKFDSALLCVCVLLCVFAIGFAFGTVSANRRTLRTAMEHIHRMETPVDRLNAQDAAALVAVSATPRFRRTGLNNLEEYEPNKWVYTVPQWRQSQSHGKAE